MPFCAQRCRTSVFGIMSCHLMLAMRLRQRMWNWSSLRMCRRYGVHASHPYNSVGSTTSQYTLILVARRTPRSLPRRLVSLPNDPLALPIRAEISSSISVVCSWLWLINHLCFLQTDRQSETACGSGESVCW